MLTSWRWTLGRVAARIIPSWAGVPRAQESHAGAAHAPKEAVIPAALGQSAVLHHRPRLLACDIDGTLLDERGLLRPEVRNAVALIRSTGVRVVLATGRSPWSGIRELAAELSLTGPQVSMQGALISEPESGLVHRRRGLSSRLYRQALAFAHSLDLDPIVGMADGHRAVRLPFGTDLFVTPMLEGHGFGFVDDLDALAEHGPIRLFLPTGPTRHRAVREAAIAHFGADASVIWGDLTGVEILAASTHKGEAVAWFASMLGHTMAEVAAVGDAMNDREMLHLAGWSAAMAAAPAEVVATADIVVPASSESGILLAFSWFFPDLAHELGRLRRGATHGRPARPADRPVPTTT